MNNNNSTFFGFSSFMRLDEIDWQNTFSDVGKVCPDAKEVVKYLNDVKGNANAAYGERKKFPIKSPFIHSKSSFFQKDKSEVDVDEFIQRITKQPNNIINTNEKILKSGGPHEFVYKTGIPAFRGIVYDLENKKFFFVNTCPGAGDCVVKCYARKGNYIRYPNSYDSMTRRINYLLNYPDKYEEQLYQELKAKCEEHEAKQGHKPTVVIRWNDSGDFFGVKYENIATDVKNKLTKEGYKIKAYAYTKVAETAKKSKVGLVTFSQGATNIETEKAKNVERNSYIIPKSIFSNLNLMKIEDEDKLKLNVISYMKSKLKIDIPFMNLLSYDELKQMPEQGKPRWYVIVTSEDGDDAAFRKDVKGVLLLEH